MLIFHAIVPRAGRVRFHLPVYCKTATSTGRRTNFASTRIPDDRGDQHPVPISRSRRSLRARCRLSARRHRRSSAADGALTNSRSSDWIAAIIHVQAYIDFAGRILHGRGMTFDVPVRFNTPGKQRMDAWGVTSIWRPSPRSRRHDYDFARLSMRRAQSTTQRLSMHAAMLAYLTSPSPGDPSGLNAADRYGSTYGRFTFEARLRGAAKSGFNVTTESCRDIRR